MDGSETGGRGARDAATVLPFVVALLLIPPAILIFAKPVTIAGLPLIVVYLFGVWAVAIIAATVIAGRLARTDTEAGTQSLDEGRR